MRFWCKFKHPLTIALIIFVFTVLRIVLPAMPYDWNFLLNFRWGLTLISLEFFHSSWTLWDLILLALAVRIIIKVPTPEGYSKKKRYLLPILSIIVVFTVTTPLVTASITAAHDAYDDHQDQLRQKELEATYRNIRAFLNDADIGFAYNTNTQRFDTNFLKAFPELTSTHLYIDDNQTKVGHHVTDIILLDYDTHRAAIVYFRYGDPEFYLYELQPVDRITNQFPQHTTQLPPPGETFVSYSYSFDLGQYTDILALTMADGKIYAVSGLSKENDLLFLGLNSQTELLNYWSNQND